MNRNDTIRIAKEAGFQTDICRSGADVWIDDGYYVKELTRFAALVAAAEREACAKVCDARVIGDHNREDQEAKRCADAIRARGEQEQPR